MDDPVSEIHDVVLRLTTGSDTLQQQTLEQYFTKDASFNHPFCSVNHNRGQILRIFQWYKILSPSIQLTVNSIAYDKKHNVLYVNISQTFKIWFVPFYSANVNLTTVLQLVRGQLVVDPLKKADKYYIQSQNDLYQVDQFVKFFLPFGIGVAIVSFWHWFATLACVLGATILQPLHSFIFAYKHSATQSASTSQSTNGASSKSKQDHEDTYEELLARLEGRSDARSNIGGLERRSNLGCAYVDGA